LSQPSQSTQADLKLHQAWIILGYVMLVIVAVLSLTPAPDVGTSDKVQHLVTYLILSGWFCLIKKNDQSLILIVIGLIIFGVILEYAQGFVGYRVADSQDALANSLGVLIGILFRFTPLKTMLYSFDEMLYVSTSSDSQD